MNDFTDFFRKLTDSSDWPPRWRCGNWTEFHGWLYIASDLTVWSAYFFIPLIILDYLRRKTINVDFPKVYLLFAAFILLCGMTHFLDAVMFWYPAYRLNALVRFATGVVSMFTVYHLFRLLPVFFEKRTSVELEEEIRRREEVELDLRKKTTQLQLANKQLEAFAYMASHDLQEPLRKVTYFSEILNKTCQEEKAKVVSEKLMNAAIRMRGLIDSVLELSTIHDKVEMEAVDLNRVLRWVQDDLALHVEETGAVVTVGNLPQVRGNRNYLRQVFLNLLNNALKFNRGTPRIEVAGRVEGETVVITVSDNGIGMENTTKIFNAFERLNAKHEYAGSGIGLSIVKRIVEVHEGRIWVESKAGEGTTFFIKLKRANENE